MRGAWIEIISADGVLSAIQSLPMRGAWIEMHGINAGDNVV